MPLEDGPCGLRWRTGSDLADFDAASLGARWQEAAQLGAGTPLQGMDQGSASEAFVRWLCEQRRLHHQRWRSAAEQALAQAAPERVAQLAEQLLRADPSRPWPCRNPAVPATCKRCCSTRWAWR